LRNYEAISLLRRKSAGGRTIRKAVVNDHFADGFSEFQLCFARNANDYPWDFKQQYAKDRQQKASQKNRFQRNEEGL
jgi:hypothetical protein